MDWISVYIALFAAALVFSLAYTPLCKYAARKWNFLDIPKCEGHKLHAKATPLLGGLGMCAAFLSTAGCALLAKKCFPHLADRDVVQASAGIRFVSRETAVLFLCAVLATLLGMYDDKYSMKAWKKLIGQIIIAAIAVTWGSLSISLFVANPAISWCISVFWIILIFNAVNFFDNMDGLAVGTCTIAFVFFAVAAAVNQQYLVSALAAASAGSAMGFWFYNRAPAGIFMGDSGSHFLAFLIAAVSAKVTYYTPGVSTTRLTVMIPLFILAVPLLDTLAVVLIRIHNHKPIYIGDHNHISHRFLHMGLTRPQAVSMVHLLCLISGLGALPLLWGDEKTTILLILQGLVIFLLITFLQFALYKGDPK